MAIHSRVGEAADWAQNAQGILGHDSAAGPDRAEFGLTQWPPPGARPLDIDDLYGDLATSGIDYGQTFQGVTAAWRHGDAIYAKISLPEQAHDDAKRFGIHPALLDAVLHAIVLDGLLPPAEPGRPYLPFAWQKTTLHATGPTDLRVRITPGGDAGVVDLAMADAMGAPVASVAALTLRPAEAQSARRDALFRVDWIRAAVGPVRDTPPYEIFEVPRDGSSVPEAARRVTHDVLVTAQEWLAAERGDSRLVIVTRGAVQASPDEGVADLAQAMVWGLVRAAQSERPDQFVLLDLDEDSSAERVIASALAVGEPQLALRDSQLWVPRLSLAGADTVTAPRIRPGEHGPGHRRHRRARLPSSPATWSPGTTSATSCSPAAAAPTPPARQTCTPS